MNKNRLKSKINEILREKASKWDRVKEIAREGACTKCPASQWCSFGEEDPCWISVIFDALEGETT